MFDENFNGQILLEYSNLDLTVKLNYNLYPYPKTLQMLNFDLKKFNPKREGKQWFYFGIYPPPA